MQTVHIFSKWVGYIDPSFQDLKYSVRRLLKSYLISGHCQTKYHSIDMNVIKFNVHKKSVSCLLYASKFYSLRKRLRILSVISVIYNYITVLYPFNLLIRFKCYNTV